VNRDSGTASANGCWLLRIVRCHVVLSVSHAKTLTGNSRISKPGNRYRQDQFLIPQGAATQSWSEATNNSRKLADPFSSQSKIHALEQIYNRPKL
jgi:hypothetical protein